MGVKFANNAYGTLNASITNTDTSLTLSSGQGARFPSLGAGDYFYVTLIDTSNNLEIAKCTARSSDVLTITRGQEGTTARAYAVGDRVELRITAGGIGAIYTEAVADATPAADSIVNSMIATGAVNGDSILDNSVTATELAVSGNGTSGQALLSDGDGTFSWGTGGDYFGTLSGPYVNGGTFAGNYSATTMRTVSLAAGRYFILFNSSVGVQFPSTDPDMVEVYFREGSTNVIHHSHGETDTQTGAPGPTASMTTAVVRTYGSTTSVNVYVPAGGDGDGGGLYLKTNIMFYKLD